MEIKKTAQAGSFESSDIMVLIEPAEKNSGRKIELDSTVFIQYGNSLKQLIKNKLDEFEIKDIRLIAKDKGALEVTVNARLETAILRAAGLQKGTLL